MSGNSTLIKHARRFMGPDDFAHFERWLSQYYSGAKKNDARRRILQTVVDNPEFVDPNGDPKHWRGWMEIDRMSEREGNPVKRKNVTENAYINRPSQITRKSPTKRLKRRRAEAVKHPVKGRFPNPARQRKSVTNRWGEKLRVGDFIQVRDTRSGKFLPESYTIRAFPAPNDYSRAYGVQLEHSGGWTVGIDDVRIARVSNPIRRKGVSASTYVRRPSQATKRAPTKRLQERRKRALKAPAGYFPNPRGIAVYFTKAGMAYGKPVAVFTERAKAEEYGRALASATGRQVGIKG